MQDEQYYAYATSSVSSRALDKSATYLQELRRRQAAAASATAWNWRATCFTGVTGGVLLLILAGQLALFVVLLAAIAVVVPLALRGGQTARNLLFSLAAGALWVPWVPQRIRVGVFAAKWGARLESNGTHPVVTELVRHMLGDDPDSLFIPDRFEWGLGAPRDSVFFVENGARRQLERKLKHMQDGTIAVCGPRGAGKTTLLKHAVQEATFGLIAQAPSTYLPQDFLLSLSVQLCQKYLRSKEYHVPTFTRLSQGGNFRRKVKRWMKKSIIWVSFAIPAGTLLALGFSATAHSIYALYAHPAANFVNKQVDHLRGQASNIWQGQAVLASVCAIILGTLWWGLREKYWLHPLLAKLWQRVSRIAALFLAVLPFASLFLDKQIRHTFSHLSHTQSEELTRTVLKFILFTFAWWILCAWRDSGVAVGDFPLEKVLRPIAAVAGLLLLGYLITNNLSSKVLADPDNPLRFAGLFAAIVVARAGGWRPQPDEPELVGRCRDYLYRLQTSQQSTQGTTTGVTAQVLSLGSNHGTSVSTLPPNYPELVDEFRSILGEIAREKTSQWRGTVIIAIDEVDRLGNDVQALEFLREIKAILGVPHVYYLISVAEDVGAAFVRRGLPHRDVTDSSLDDVIYVQPSTLGESRAILAERSERLNEPHITLAHALSGGILRDLLRYGLQICEVQDTTQSHELTELTRHLILEELAETFAGFRTLLSKQQWSPGTSDVLSSFRIFANYLRDPCPCSENEVTTSLKHFAFYSHAAPRTASTNNSDPNPSLLQEITEEARQIIDEASAYAYFSLTILEIFGVEGLERRRQLAALHGPDGDPDCLAQARQELGISPYSARSLIDSIRKAWSLPVTSAGIRNSMPLVAAHCSRHGVTAL
ncbi:hypothetical protein ACFWFU_04560 [Streptomyces sp. NPDC060235]|uniref:hypothetical protein n=1 Tax=Streptomyces sp. NPDC060235 TaxID=3347080 RepID=UPI00364AF425